MAAFTFTALDQDARVARAFRKGGDLVWRLTPCGAWRCETPQGKEYTVSAAHCSCPDFEHRCSKVGARCYHQIALGHQLIAVGVGLLAANEGPERGAYPCDGCGFHTRVERLTKCPVTGNLFCPACQERPAPEFEPDEDPFPEPEAEHCPQAGERTHLGWYCPACLRDQPSAAVEEAPGPLSPADLAEPVRLTAEELDAAWDRVFGDN